MSENKNFLDVVVKKLQKHFGHEKFKSPLQEKAVRAIAKGTVS